MNDTTNLNQSNLGKSPNWTPGGAGQVPGNLGGPPPPEQKGVHTTTYAQFTVQEDLLVPNDQKEINESVDLNIASKFSQYVTLANVPILKPSTVNDPIQAEKTLKQLIFPNQQALDNLKKQVESALIGKLPDEEYAEYAERIVNDPEIKALSEKTGVPLGIIEKNVKEEKNNLFSTLISNLPQEQANKLQFAYFVPQAAAELSPELKAKFDAIMQQVHAGVTKNFGFSEQWAGVETDATDFNGKLSIEFDVSFENLLYQKVEAGTIEEADAQVLRAMHYGFSLGTPSLRNMLKQLEGTVTEQMRAKFGFDINYQPKPDSSNFNSMISGEFSKKYEKLIQDYIQTKINSFIQKIGNIRNAMQYQSLQEYLKSQKPPPPPFLDSHLKDFVDNLMKEKSILLSSFPNIAEAKMPADLKHVASKFVDSLRMEIIQKYGLNKDWDPITSLQAASGVSNEALVVAQNSVTMLRELIEIAKEFGINMPDDKDKAQFLSFLLIISKALISIQETIYAMQANQSKQAQALSRAKLEAELDNIAQQQKAADEMRARKDKMMDGGGLKVIDKIMKWFVNIAALSFSIAMGPAAFAIALAYFIDAAVAEATGDPSMVQRMFQEISKSLPPAAAGVVNVAIATAIGFISANPFIAANLITQDTRCMQDFIKAAGGDTMAQEIGAMVLQTVVQLAFMVVMIIATGGASTPLIIASVAQMIAQASAISLSMATKIVKVAMAVVQLVIFSIQVTSSVIKINNNILLSQIDIIKGESEAYSEKIQGIIAALKKVIEKLLAMLQQNSEAIVNINNFQGQKWDAASQVTSEIAG